MLLNKNNKNAIFMFFFFFAVVKTTILLQNIADYAKVNSVYSKCKYHKFFVLMNEKVNYLKIILNIKLEVIIFKMVFVFCVAVFSSKPPARAAYAVSALPAVSYKR